MVQRSLCCLVLVTVAFTGCVTKSKADAKAREAFLAGQQQAMMRVQQSQLQTQGPSVTVNGEVRNHVIPWTEDLTLAKALVAADYCGASDPGEIYVVRSGRATRVEAKQLFTGVDVPLQPGDIVQLTPQAAAPSR